MKRVVVAMFAMTALFLTPALPAQHSGSRTGSNSGGAPPPSGNNVDLTDFKHLLEVQADTFQTAQLQTMNVDTGDAIKQAQKLAQAANGSALSNQALAVNNAVDQACKSNKQLVKMLTNVQIAGLKKLLKDLNKSESAVTRQQKLLAQAANGNADEARLRQEASGMEKALADFRASQNALSQEMGVQPPGSDKAAPSQSDPNVPR